MLSRIAASSIHPYPMTAAALPSRAMLRDLARAGWPALAALIVAELLRHLAVEPAAIAHACDPAPWQGWCAARSALILAFATQGIGWAALAAGLYATWRRDHRWAQAALVLGSAGLVLYSFEPSVLGALLGAMVLLRPGSRYADR